MEERVIRPIPVGRIKNNALRRISMIVFFIPIVLVGYIMHLFDVCLFLVRGLLYIPWSLAESGIEFWDKPKDKLAEGEDNND